MLPHVVCTLCERNSFFKGAIVLLNSLIEAGFEGDFVIGHRKVSASSLRAFESDFAEFKVSHPRSEMVNVQLVRVDTSRHLTNFKPFFLRQILQQSDDIPSGLWYIDPDIVVKAAWTDLLDWIQYGIAVCEDLNSPIYPRHPRRMQWHKVARRNEITEWRELRVYANAGFIGLKEDNYAFLDRWRRFITIMENIYDDVPGSENSALKVVDSRDGSNEPFFHMDQDCLNAALTCSSWDISFIGKEGMDFAYGGQWMSHATGSCKPWNKPFIKSALQGKGLRQVDRLYWDCADKPLQAHTPSEIRNAKRRIKVAAFVERFIA